MKVGTTQKRYSRQATAYARLAAKASRAGEWRRAEQLQATAARFRRMADRERERRSARGTAA